MDKLVNILNSIPAKIKKALEGLSKKQSTAQPLPTLPSTAVTTEVPPTVEVKQMRVSSKLNIKKFAIAGGAILLLLVLVIIGAQFLPKGGAKATPTPSIEPTLPPFVPTPPPTRYATDSAVLKIEEDLKILDLELGGVDLDESNLKQRPLDFDINFK